MTLEGGQPPIISTTYGTVVERKMLMHIIRNADLISVTDEELIGEPEKVIRTRDVAVSERHAVRGTRIRSHLEPFRSPVPMVYDQPA
jgi:hypothetical protein